MLFNFFLRVTPRLLPIFRPADVARILIIQDASARRQIWAVWPHRPIFTSTTRPPSPADTAAATATAATAAASATPPYPCAVREYGSPPSVTRWPSGLRGDKSEYVDESVQSLRRRTPERDVSHRVCWSRSRSWSWSWRRRRDRVGQPCGADGIRERCTDAAATTTTSNPGRTVSAGWQGRRSCEDADTRRLETQPRAGNGRVETVSGEVSVHCNGMATLFVSFGADRVCLFRR